MLRADGMPGRGPKESTLCISSDCATAARSRCDRKARDTGRGTGEGTRRRGTWTRRRPKAGPAQCHRPRARLACPRPRRAWHSGCRGERRACALVARVPHCGVSEPGRTNRSAFRAALGAASIAAPRRMRAGHASFRRAGCAAGASGGRDVVGSASRRRQASTRLAGRGDWRRRLAALSLVCGYGRGGRTDEQSVTVGRPEWSGVRTWSRRGDGDAGSGISRDDRSPVRAARRRGSRLGESRDVRGGGRCGPRLGGDGAPQAERQRGAQWREAERHRLRANYPGAFAGARQRGSPSERSERWR